MPPTDQHAPASREAGRRRTLLYATVFLVALVATAVVAFVLVTMFEHKQDARTPFVRVAEVDEITTDPRPWGMNWPHQYDGWKETAGGEFEAGSSALTASKLEQDPWLVRLYAGYAFSIDYREARGHAYMLYDQGVTERVTQKPQAGACLHCHGSVTVLYRKVGLEAMGQPADDEALAADFNMPAVRRGFQELSQRPYFQVLQMLAEMPDGYPEVDGPVFPMPPAGGFTGEIAGEHLPADHPPLGNAHPVTCIDCHDPKTMAIRVTRPGFMQGIADLAAGDAPAPHLPSIDKWRRGNRKTPYDPNTMATRQEMRSFVCGQCHVEYYCANKMTLEFPWSKGLRAEDLERHWNERKFPDGTAFYDYKHGETGAPVYKVQHPEFEMWSQGIHARAGVSCSDCHMPYQRTGAMKVSNHDVKSPVAHLNQSCQQCHNVPEAELADRIKTIQSRTVAMTDRAGEAMTDMLDAIVAAKAAGAPAEALEELYALQRGAMWRLDYVSSENSKGFHADQEAMRLLAESIDLSRRAEAKALRLRAPEPPQRSDENPVEPVKGITDK